MSKRDPSLLIEDILDSANKIIEYTSHLTFEEFTKDSKTIDAVIRNFEIIGEAASRLPEFLRKNIVKLIGIEFVDFGIELYITISVLTIPLFGKLRKHTYLILFLY
jgi:hypothetical protein